MTEGRNKILEELYNRKDLMDVIKNITNGDQYYEQELLQELFLSLSELPEDRLFKIKEAGYLDWYIIKTLKNMFDSTSSKFFYKIKKHIQISVDHLNDEGESFLNSVPEDAINDDFKNSDDYKESLRRFSKIPNYYDSKYFDLRVLELYKDLGTIKAVCETTGISKQYVSECLKRAKAYLKEKISEEVKRKRQ